MPKESIEESDASGIQKNPDVYIWDTQYCSSSKAFGVFREGICSTFMPWSPEFKSENAFEARIESLNFANGSVGRVRMSPLSTFRTKENIANSSVDGFYANFVLAGELNVEQYGRITRARPGDLVIYDTSAPTKATGSPDSQYEDLSFLFSKSNFSTLNNPEDVFGNVVLPRSTLIGPLSSCLTLMSEHFLSSSRGEMTALFDACVALLPFAGRRPANGHDGFEDTTTNELKREIIYYINQDLANEALSPQRVATHFGICPRYVHKIFASLGTTFTCYVNEQRLDRIRLDLVSDACRHQPISSVAYRWGFNNLSTFIRLFKKRYGCPPSQYRLRLEG
jgi:AraC family transcriptional regulator, positive regulator of tynA and feaB